jgi:hypothetical protein
MDDKVIILSDAENEIMVDVDEPVEQETETQPDLMVDVEEVISFHGLKPKHLGYDKTDTAKLKQTITQWILQCEDLIKQYTNNTFTNEVPAAVKNVCIRLCSNMITLAIQKRDSPIIKVKDWTVAPISSDIFTQDLKDDLKPFIKDYSTTSDTITFFAITGDD